LVEARPQLQPLAATHAARAPLAPGGCSAVCRQALQIQYYSIIAFLNLPKYWLTHSLVDGSSAITILVAKADLCLAQFCAADFAHVAVDVAPGTGSNASAAGHGA
jgi:hypothetical protein